jgi:hypothetical protein
MTIGLFKIGQKMENYLILIIPYEHTAAKFSNPFYNCKLNVQLN